MEISKQDAQLRLQEIDQIMQHTRRSLLASGAANYLMLWGSVWLLGYSITQFLPDYSGVSWLFLDVLGIVISFYFGFRHARNWRSKQYGPRVGLFWFFVLMYAALFVWLIPIQSPLALSLFFSLFISLGFVSTGLWLLNDVLVYLGVGLTILIVFGFLFVKEFFYLWVAILGGGTMLGLGFKMRNQGKAL